MADKNLQTRFGQIVRKRRIALSVSQEELADIAGLHRTYISLLERGLRNPSLDVLSKLARSLKTTMGRLVSELD